MKFILVSTNESTTGGVESTHQFGNAIKRLGYECEMFYVGKSNKAKDHFNFYGVPAAKEIDDHEDNVVIFPEIMTNIIKDIHYAKKGIFWLSVDNYFYRKRENIFLDKFNQIRSLIGGRLTLSKMKDFIHLAQSQYSADFLKSNNLESFYIGDYLNDDFIKTIEREKNTIKKQKKVVFNPSKGKRFTRLFIDLFPDIEMVPLINMSREEVIKNLKSSMIYLDLGQHPGRDRIPREAAIQDCIIFTSLYGSAKNDIDIPISDFYKNKTNKKSIELLGNKIYEVFDDFDKHYQEQKKYRDIILSDKEKVMKNVEIFVKKILSQ